MLALSVKTVSERFKLPGLLPFAAAAVFAAVLVSCPEPCVNGAAAGLRLCAAVVIPSLFPFLAISSFAASSPSGAGVLKIFSPLMRHVFRLPACAASAVVFGFFGGFPVGCSVAAQLYSQGRITAEQAQRITCFCVNAGPAYVITAVGTVMLGNIKAGLILFVSLLLSGLALGAALGLTAAKPEKTAENYCPAVTNSQALVEAVEKSSLSMLKICAWTVLFSCFSGAVASFGFEERIMTAFNCVFEVTSGCMSAAKNGNLCSVAATLGWGGLCVGCQVLGSVRTVGTRLSVFFAFRAVNAGLSAVICGMLLELFPLEAEVFSNVAAVCARQFSYSLPATVALMCLCAVFVIDLDRNKKVC